MAKSMSRVDSSYDTQIAAIEKLTRAIESLKAQDLGSLNNTKLDNVQKEFVETQKEATGLTGRLKDLGTQMSKKLPANALIGAAALSGLVQGVRNVIALSKGVAGFFASFVSGATSIAASIIAIPFKMFSGLVDMAAQAGGGMNELAQALENLRKEMGDLKGPGTKAVLTASESLKGFADTGLNAYQVFGTLAERIEAVTKVAVSMGSTFGVLKKEFEDNGGALLAFQKGLGVSDEGMKAIGDRAIALGKPMSKVFLEMTKQTTALGEAFDIDQKLIGKDMTKAMMDVKHFGALTVKELGQASVYARKLGVELDKITGTLDQFETFDSAADSAAKLSQSFGVSVDAFKLMEAQSPAEQIDMLRKSFKEAGVDASQFTRQQAKLLAQTTGLDEATARQVFSMKNQGVGLDDVKKKSEAAEKKTLTQAEAMSKLADSIERMVKSGGAQSGGFWDQFVKGFLGGIQSSKEFRDIIMNIKKSLQLVYFEGVKLGRAFVELFPGVKEFLQGIADFFNPTKFKKLVGGVTDELISWIKELQDPHGKASFASLMTKLQKKFFNFFNEEMPEGKKMLEGFKRIFKTIAKVVAEGVKWVADQVAAGIVWVTDMLSGKTKVEGAGAAAKGGLGFLGEVLAPLGEALKHAWKVLEPAVVDLLKTLGKKIFKYLTSSEFLDLVKPALPALIASLFGPTVFRTALSFGVKAIGKSIFGMLKNALTGPAAVGEADGVAEGLGGVMSKSLGGLGKFLGPIGIAIAIGDAAVHIKDAMDKFEKKLEPEFGEAASKVGAGATGIIDALTFGLLPDDLKEQIARAIADVASKLFATVEDYFGKTFSDKLKDYVSSELDVFSSLGGLIKSLFSGNDQDIADALSDFGEKLVKYFGKMVDFLMEAIPTIAVKIEEFMTHLAGRFFHIMAKVFAKGKNIPVIGGLFSALSKVFDLLGDGYDKISEWLGKLGKLFKADGVGKTLASPFVWAWDKIKGVFDAIADFFEPWTTKVVGFFQDTWDGIVGIWSGVKDWFHKHVIEPISDAFESVVSSIADVFSKLWDEVKKPWNDAKVWFNDHVVQPITDVFNGLVDAIKKPFDDAWDDIKTVFSSKNIQELFDNVVQTIKDTLNKLLDIPAFNDMIKVAKATFKISSPSKVFSEMGGDIVDGMSLGLSDITEVMKTHMGDAAKAAGDSTPELIKNVQNAVNAAKAAQETAVTEVAKGLSAKASDDTTASLVASVKSSATAISKIADTVSKGGVQQALKAVNDMVKVANDLDAALNQGLKVDLPVKLSKIATAVGLGGKFNYTIRNKDVVVQINMQVTMNAGEVEKVIFMRQGSFVRQRLDFLADEAKATPQILPGNPYTQVPGAPVALGKGGASGE